MKKILGTLASATVAMALTLCFAASASAIPALQLDIVGGAYDSGDESTLTSDPVFTLQAFLSEDNDNKLNDIYYLSVAVVPRSTPSGDYGSFAVSGVVDPVNVTEDMQFGTPPLDALYPDLGSHSIFDTYYVELDFTFGGAMVDAYNVQDGTPGSGQMYVKTFDFDLTGLSSAINLHFDLYNENLIEKKNGDDYSTQFAPFSHDAGTNRVPEPGTLLLLGAGLLGLGLMRRKK